MKILFLIPVHEKNEIVDDTIKNITKYNFNDDCYFCLIVNTMFKDFDYNYFSSIKNVIITEREYREVKISKLQKYITQIKALIESYIFVRDKIDFDYVVVFHTSQLFVKTGYSEYIKNYETSLRPREWYLKNRFFIPYEKWTLEENFWGDTLTNLHKFIGNNVNWNINFEKKFKPNTLIDEMSKSYETKFPYAFTPIFEMQALKNVLPDYRDMNFYHYQCIEESFYKKDIFDYVTETILNNLTLSLEDLSMFFGYANIEEIIIPTLSTFKSKFIGNNTLYWIENFNENKSYSQWLDILENKLEKYHFTVKSVPREIDHTLREITREKK